MTQATQAPERIIDKRLVTFIEEPQPDGSLHVAWERCAPITWNAILDAVKKLIPPGHRAYLRNEKRWIISSSQIQTWKTIKDTFSHPDDLELRLELEQGVTDEAIVELLRADVGTLPKAMKRRATYAIKAVLGMIETKVEYSYSRDEFGAWDAQKKVWCFTDGRYSRISPKEIDLKQQQRTYDAIARAAAKIPDLLAFMEMEAENSWKWRFRKYMLEKYEWRCYTCKQTPSDLSELHMHRVIPGKDGGEYVEDNVVILCRTCHTQYEGSSWSVIHAASKGGAE